MGLILASAAASLGSSALAQVTLRHEYPAGWNLVSVPVQAQDPSPGAVFQDADPPVKVYDYAGGLPLGQGEGGFFSVAPGRGYWLLLGRPTRVEVQGSLAGAGFEYRVPLVAGWNAVADPWPVGVDWGDARVSVSDGATTLPLGAAVAQSWIEGPLRSYDPATGSYGTLQPNAGPPAQLQPWQGYELYSNIAGELIFAPLVQDNTPPTVQLTAPGDGAELAELTDATGTASDDNLLQWTLEYAPYETGQYTLLASGDTSVVNGILAQLDPGLLYNGIGVLRLSAVDLAGNSASDSREVKVAGEDKIGNFRITLVDLKVPLVGIPITLKRTYDSRSRGKSGDFGWGWSLEAVAAGRYVNNRPPGDGWEFPNSFPPCQFAQPTKTHVTDIRFNDEEFFQFAFVVEGLGATFGGCVGQAKFVRVGGYRGAKLEVLGNNQVLWQAGTDYVVDFDTLDLYEPRDVRLTTRNGREYDFHLGEGLVRASDRNGNQVFIGPNGVVHSSGRSISYTRDGFGRITAITDLMGRSIQYGYNGAGELASVTDRTNKTFTYAYAPRHFLKEITDPSGKKPLRAEYDAAGALIGLLDAKGQRIQIERDAPENYYTVTDRLNRALTYQYNASGFLSQVTDTGGQTTQFTKDADGQVLSRTDPLGATTSFTYSPAGDLSSVTDPLGNTETYAHDDQGEVTSVVDARGKVTTNTFDLSGNLQTTVDPEGGATSYTYDSHGNPQTETDARGFTTSYLYNNDGQLLRMNGPLGSVLEHTYDANGNQLTETVTRTVGGNTVTETTTSTYDAEDRLVARTDPLGNTSTFTYDAYGLKLSQADPRGNTTSFEYDGLGQLVQETYADGTTKTYDRDPEGKVISETDRLGRTTAYERDALGRVTKTTYPDGSTTENTFDVAGRLVAVKNERGFTTQFEYDAAGRRKKIVNALGHETSFTYDQNGNLVTVKDANNHTTTSEYDGLNRLKRVIHPDGSSHMTTYDALGHKLTETDPAGKLSSFAWDALERLTRVDDALGQATTYSYDQVGNLLALNDANGHTTSFAYDANRRMTKRTLPLGMLETLAYDPAGNLSARTDFNGRTTSYTYDVNNRLSAKSYPGGGSVSFTYRPTGPRATAADFRGVTTYSYDLRDRLAQVVQPDGRIVAYAYDAAGNRTAVTVPSGTTSATFDAVDRLLSVTAPGGGQSSYQYDPAGNLTGLNYPSGARTLYSHDALDRVLNVTNSRSDNSVLSAYTYTLGLAGHRTRVVEATGRSVDYAYDDVYRLVTETITVPGSGATAISYTYDPAGNRLTRTDAGGTTTYTYDNNDRLLGEGAASYAYDQNGNQTGKTENAVTTTFTYDDEDRLVGIQAPGNVVLYQYDVDGNRVRSSVNSAVTDYLVDTNRDYAQVLEERDGAGALRASYVHGHDLISTLVGGSAFYYHTDAQGSTRQLSNAAQAVTDTYTYDAFGVSLGQTGSTPNPYRYTGEQRDQESGLYYLRARYYNPTAGRFLSMDPLLGDTLSPATLHRYLYVENDPVNNLDPSGQETLAGIMVRVNVTLGHVGARVGGALVTGGRAAGMVWRVLGRYAEIICGQVLRLNPSLTFTRAFSIGGRRTIDFFLRSSSGRTALLEVKYSLPQGGASMVRLVNQMNGAIATNQGQVVLWSLRAPTTAQVGRVLTALGPNAGRVQFVHGVEGLFNWMRLFFGAF